MLNLRVLPSLAGTVIAITAIALLAAGAGPARRAEAAANQTISFGSISSRTFGSAPFLISASATSGLAVTFTPSGPCTAFPVGPGIPTTATVTLTGAGTCSITASQAGDGTWNPAPAVVRSFTIYKASQTITLASITNKVYGTAPLDIIATASSGLPVTVTASGKCTVAPGDELGDDGDDFDVTLTGAGLCTVRATQAGSANYNSAFSVTRTFSVTRAPLSITGENDTRVYKQANPLIGYVAAGFVPGETIANLSGTLTCSASALSNSAVGTYSTSCSGVYSSNYNITFVKGVFTVTKATQTITFAAIPAKTYGDASFTVSPTSDSGLFVTVAVTSGPCTASPGSFFGPISILGAGSCEVTVTQAGNANYLAATPAVQTFAVNPKALTVTAQNKTIDEGQNQPPYTVTYSGFVIGESAANLGGALSCAAYVSFGPDVLVTNPVTTPGSYTIRCSGQTSTNYTITYLDGTLTVNDLP